MAMVGVDLDLALIHHRTTPAMPVCATAINARLWVAALSLSVARDDLIVIERVEISFRANWIEVHSAAT